ncbi:MAG: hypothetical protein HYX63_19285 [Gammaproteobacteria bacterium]|nr:hypothetical protein [Gammaproteobacteria bacterium]
MNEYVVTYELDGVTAAVMVHAETAALARKAIPGAENVNVKFVRAVSFSCRIRGAQR